MTVYLLDTNVFLEAKNHHYGFDICPAFWDWLDAQNQAGVVTSIEDVADELDKEDTKEDDIKIWVKIRRDRFFPALIPETVLHVNNIRDWIQGKQYSAFGVKKFMECADPFLIAQAMAYGHTVVTREKSAPESIRSVKIPDVCKHFEVSYMDPFEMLRKEGARFILGPEGKAAP